MEKLWIYRKSCLLAIFTVYLNYNGRFVSGSSALEDLTLSRQEKMDLDQFKIQMIPKLHHDYMKEDIYLIRWLRSQKFNLEQAEKVLKEHLRWRKEFKMDTILKEDWSDMKDEYPSVLDTFDKAGRPVTVANFGTWDLRKAILTGRSERLLRYTFKTVEEATQKVVELQHQGKNVTRWKAIYNMDGFNIAQHACPRCMFFIITFVSSFQENYPGCVDAAIVLNAPTTFQIVLDALRPVFNSEARKVLKVFGTDKKQWRAYLDQEISSSQRRYDLGGTRGDS